MIFQYFSHIAHAVRLISLSRRLQGTSIPILAYHNVFSSMDDEPSCLELAGLSVDTDKFIEQMEFIQKYYNTINFEDLLLFHHGRRQLPPNPIIITFDDGFLNVYENAVPVLEGFGLTATFFIITKPIISSELPWLYAMYQILDSVPFENFVAVYRDFIFELPNDVGLDKKKFRSFLSRSIPNYNRSQRNRILRKVISRLNPQINKRIEFMDIEQIRDIAERGFEVGCHSVEHDCLSGLADDEIEEDVQECKTVIAGIIGREPVAFGFPFGWKNSYDDRVIAVLKKKRFSMCRDNKSWFLQSEIGFV